MPAKRTSAPAIPRNKQFCIAGPIIPSRNYFIGHRLDWIKIKSLIDGAKYFVLHAPRQSGKTTAIKELTKKLNHEGAYLALSINVEPAQAARDHVEKSSYINSKRACSLTQ